MKASDTWWTVRVVSGGLLIVAAAVLVPVGFVESTWADRATVWATALTAAALGAQLLSSAASARPAAWAAVVAAVVRWITTARTWLWGLCLVLPLVMTGAVPESGLRAATGDVMLFTDARGQVSLVVALKDGGLASCSLPAGGWSSEWSSPRIDSGWGRLGRGAGFHSARGTFQVLGQREGELVQGRLELDPQRRWYGHYDVLVDGEVVTTARGRPAFFQHIVARSQYWYLALVPEITGGIRVYARNVYWLRGPLVEPGIGLVDSAAAVDHPDEGVKAILRVGERLYSLTKRPDAATEDLFGPWSRAEELRTRSGAPVRAAGDPALIRTAATGADSPPRYKLAVPSADGLELLTAVDFEPNRWTAEPLPIEGSVDSVALVDTTIAGRPGLLVAYRTGDAVHATFTSATSRGGWRPPERISCSR